ncbi:MAG: AAA family ATPase [Prochloraceae cyanobacterium]|nr:AAA family ATPase [Prochloraceae cyanobacterium]
MTLPIIKRFLISLDENKWLGLLGFCLCLTGATFFALQPRDPQMSQYQAIGKLIFTPQPPTFTSTGQQLQQQGRAIINETTLLLNPQLLADVGARTGLSIEELKALLENEVLIVDFPQENEPQVINIERKNARNNIEQAQLLVQVLMQEMVARSRQINSASLEARITDLTSRLGDASKDLEDAEKGFYDYITGEGSTLLEVQDGSLFAGISSSKVQQRQLRNTLEQIEGQIKSLSQTLGLTPQEAYTYAALSADPIVGNLRAQIAQNEQQIKQRQQLRPEHPAMRELLKNQQTYNLLLVERSREIIGTDGVLSQLNPGEIRQYINLDPARQELANQLVALNTQREGLENQLKFIINTEQQLRRQYEQFPGRQIRQTRLAQELALQQTLYQTILQQLVDARSALEETRGSVAILENATIQEIPPTPLAQTSPLLIIAGGAGLGILVAGGIIFLLASIDDRLHTAQELREALGQKDVFVLGQLPSVAINDRRGEQIPIVTNSDLAYLQYYERVRSNIRRIAADSSKVILITSISHGEGKSVTAYNLAIAAANAGKRTLLVEADLRQSSQAEYLQVNPDPKANAEPLRYYSERSGAVCLAPEVENLYIVPSPGPQLRAAAIIESGELRMLIDDARGRFDTVIIDTPSLSRSNDALLLEPLTDGIVLVTRPGVTRGSMLSEALEEFLEAELPVYGAVINDVESLAPSSEASRQSPNEGIKKTKQSAQPQYSSKTQV